MKNTFTLFIAVLIAGIMLVYMFCFQVRYDEAAIVTTFGRAAPQTAGRRGSVRTKPDLYWRWPWPFQKVHIFSSRVQLMEDQLQQQMTADNKNVIIRLFMAWKINDPRKFYLKDFTEIADAEPRLRAFLKDARAVISRYRFDQLVNTDAPQLKLDEIEEEARRQISAQLADRVVDGVEVPGYGVEVLRVGIKRIMLPTTTTDRVFERMMESRLLLAQTARSEGASRANAIKSKAESASQRILAFAERSAQAIRTKGDEYAALYYGKFAADEDFAIYLRQMKMLEATLGHNATFIVNETSMPELRMFADEPALTATQGQPDAAR